MKLTGIITASMLAVGASAQQQNDTASAFDVPALYGTWHVAGITDVFFLKVTGLTQIFNFTIACPSIQIASGQDGMTSFQPSVRIAWFNETSNTQQDFDLTMDGTLTLQEGSTATEADFKVMLTPPPMPEGIAPPSGDSSGGGKVVSGNFNFKLPSGNDSSVNNVALVRSYNFSDDEDSTGPGIGSTDSTVSVDIDAPVPTDNDAAAPTDLDIDAAAPTDIDAVEPTDIDNDAAAPTGLDPEDETLARRQYDYPYYPGDGSSGGSGGSNTPPPTDSNTPPTGPTDPNGGLRRRQYDYPPYYPGGGSGDTFPDAPDDEPTLPTDPNEALLGDEEVSRQSFNDEEATALLVKGSNALEPNAFDAAVTAYGNDAANLVRLNDTCQQ